MVTDMKQYALMDRLVEAGNGYLQVSAVRKHAISNYTLMKYLKTRGMARTAHGVYATADAWPDDYYLLALRNGRIVFSHESALYLHSLMEREPAATTVTVPEGYNSTHINRQGIRVIHSKPEWYALGITNVKTAYGHEVPVYDRERTICDMIRCRKDAEVQTFRTAMREYMSGEKKKLGNLMRYAKELGIEENVRIYTEVML